MYRGHMKEVSPKTLVVPLRVSMSFRGCGPKSKDLGGGQEGNSLRSRLQLRLWAKPMKV